jgi:LmbE family N-acetylglucosaminyl deacetylase
MSEPGALSTAPRRPDRLLVVAAHPVDADYALAGSVARWVGEGTSAHLVCCTSGDGRGPDPTADPLQLAARCEREQRAAAALVGYREVTFLHRPEGALANDLALREQLTRLIRAVRPDTLAASDPRVLIQPWGAVNHADHRAAGEAALDALEPAANAMAFPQLMRAGGLEPHGMSRLLLYWSAQPTHALDVSAQLETKVGAISSQVSRTGTDAEHEGSVRAWARRDGAAAGLEAAEAFALIELA